MSNWVKRAFQGAKGGAKVLLIFLICLVALALLGMWLGTGDFYRKYVIPSVLSLVIAAIVWFRTNATMKSHDFPEQVRLGTSFRNAFRTVPVAVLALAFAETWVSAAIEYTTSLDRPAGLGQQSMLLVVLTVTVVTVWVSAHLVWVLPSETVTRNDDKQPSTKAVDESKTVE